MVQSNKQNKITVIDTYDLEFRHIFFPPEVFLELGSHGGDHIIKVHADVHEVV